MNTFLYQTCFKYWCKSQKSFFLPKVYLGVTWGMVHLLLKPFVFVP